MYRIAPVLVIVWCTIGSVSTAWAGSLSGSVENTNGAGIAWAFVDLYDQHGLYFDYTYTDDQGRYDFSNLGEGTFYARTDTLGDYVEEWYDDVPGASDQVFYDPLAAGATPIVVGWQDQLTGIDIALATAASISGVVEDADGGPVTNVYVDAYLPDGTRFLSTVTRTDGTYRLKGLPAGGYAVRTDTRGAFMDTWHEGTTAFDMVSPDEAGVGPYLQLSPGQALTGTDFTLVTGGVLGGQVVASGGEPVAGIYIDLYDDAGGRIEFSRSDTNGAFRLGGIPAGTYYLGTDSLGSYIDLWYSQRPALNPTNPVADGADAIALAAGEVRSNLVFTLDQGASISGQVLGPLDEPVSNVVVDVYRDAVFFDYALTDDSGRFEVAALPDAAYYVKVDSLGRYLDEWYLDHAVHAADDPVGDGADAVTIAGGISVTGLLFELDFGAEILGMITEEGADPVADCYIDLHDESGKRLFYTQSASNGTFRLGGLPAGTYYLCTDASYRFVDEWYDDQVLFTRSHPVGNAALALTLADRQSITNVNMGLILGGSISGTVTGPEDAPLNATYVDVFLGTNYYAYTRTDSNGQYRVNTLPQGPLYLQTDNPHDLVNEWYQDAYIFHQGLPEEDGATPIQLARDEERTGVDFDLGPGSGIQGSVNRQGDGPLSQVLIDVFDYAGRHYDVTISQADGTYGMERLPPGSWYVGTETFGEYADEWYDDVLRLTVDDPLADGAGTVVLSNGVTVTGIDFILDLARYPAGLRIERRATGEVIVSWTGDEDRAYQVERGADLPAEDWTTAPSGSAEIERSYKTAGPEGLREYRDPSPAASAHQYRVQSL